MSRRKKNPGFNPRKKALDEIKARMAGNIGIYDQMLNEISMFKDRVVGEREKVSKYPDDKLCKFTFDVLEKTLMGLAGLADEVKVKGTDLMSALDARATKIVTNLNCGMRWDMIKDDNLVLELEFENEEIIFTDFIRNSQLALIELYRYYADRVEFVRDFMKAGGTLEEAKARIAAAEQEEKEEIEAVNRLTDAVPELEAEEIDLGEELAKMKGSSEVHANE